MPITDKDIVETDVDEPRNEEDEKGRLGISHRIHIPGRVVIDHQRGKSEEINLKVFGGKGDVIRFRSHHFEKVVRKKETDEADHDAREERE